MVSRRACLEESVLGLKGSLRASLDSSLKHTVISEQTEQDILFCDLKKM